MNRFDWIKQAQQLQSNQQPFALVTVLRTQAPTSAKPGDKALVTADGSIHGWIGGGCAQPTVIKTVRQALTDGQPRNIRITPADERNERQLDDVLEFGMACHSGGTLELFIDPVLPAPQLVIIGDSAVARALTQLAPRVGLDVQLIANHAQASDFPDARQVIATDDVEALSALHLHAQDVVVATQGRRDMQGLKAALHLKPSDIWFVASARKASCSATSRPAVKTVTRWIALWRQRALPLGPKRQKKSPYPCSPMWLLDSARAAKPTNRQAMQPKALRRHHHRYRPHQRRVQRQGVGSSTRWIRHWAALAAGASNGLHSQRWRRFVQPRCGGCGATRRGASHAHG